MEESLGEIRVVQPKPQLDTILAK